MKKLLIGMALSLAMVFGLLCVGGAASAGEGGREGGPLRRFISGQIGRLMTLKSDLNLSDDQKQQIKQIVLSHRSEIVAVAKPLVESKRALRDATFAANPDEQAIRAAADKLGKAVADAAVLASKIKMEAAKVLTADQMKTLSEFRDSTDKSVDRFMQEFQDAK